MLVTEEVKENEGRIREETINERQFQTYQEEEKKESISPSV